MAILDFLKPKQKNSHTYMRINAIEELADQEILKDIAVNDSIADVRKAAIMKITDHCCPGKVK